VRSLEFFGDTLTKKPAAKYSNYWPKASRLRVQIPNAVDRFGPSLKTPPCMAPSVATKCHIGGAPRMPPMGSKAIASRPEVPLHQMPRKAAPPRGNAAAAWGCA